MAEEASAAGSNATEVPGPTFALSPALATDDIIDYSSKAGATIWREATSKLSDEAFDCDANSMRDFLELLRTRAETMGWDNSVLAIPTDPDHPEGEVKDFFSHYGELSMEDLRAVVKVYVATPTRFAQDSMQLYKCLHNSLSKIGRDRVTLHRNAYCIGGQPVGVLLLKTIIQQSHIDTNATTSAIRHALATLDSYMPVVSYDITKFNQYVRTQLEALQARGETTHDLTTNLFRAYLTVKDKDFKEYIKRKESDYEENNERLEPEKLMSFAENRFKIRKLRGIWNAPSPEDEKIIALEAKLKRMENKKPGKANPNSKETNSNSKGNQKKKFKVEDWMLVRPKPGESHDKVVDGKDWHWCPKHEKWTRHKPSECQGKGATKSGDKAKSKPQERKVRFANALSALVEEDSDEE